MTDIKFCGLRTQGDVLDAVRLEARWVGFVHFPPSPRHIEPATAARLWDIGRERVDIVSVTVDADMEQLQDIRATLAPDWIQLHGRERPEQVAAAKPFARKGVIKALPVADLADLDAASAYDGIADMILFDAKPPKGATRPGGWGATYDYALLKSLNINTPWLLSGGLDAANVRAAVEASGASAVDVSSGIEAASGEKSAEKMMAFARAVRE